MKKLLTLIAIALAVVVSSCSKFDDSAIWDKLNEQEQTLNDHEKRIAALEELCKQMNTNINALQTLVEALDSFGVKVEFLGATRGPSVTRYELLPASGVKISKITNFGYLHRTFVLLYCITQDRQSKVFCLKF